MFVSLPLSSFVLESLVITLLPFSSLILASFVLEKFELSLPNCGRLDESWGVGASTLEIVKEPSTFTTPSTLTESPTRKGLSRSTSGETVTVWPLITHWSPEMLSTTPINATGMGSTFPGPELAVGVDTTPPQALSNTVVIVRTNRSRREVFFIMHLFYRFDDSVVCSQEKLRLQKSIFAKNKNSPILGEFLLGIRKSTGLLFAFVFFLATFHSQFGLSRGRCNTFSTRDTSAFLFDLGEGRHCDHRIRVFKDANLIRDFDIVDTDTIAGTGENGDIYINALRQVGG